MIVILLSKPPLRERVEFPLIAVEAEIGANSPSPQSSLRLGLPVRRTQRVSALFALCAGGGFVV
jgi:hypothetical protein